MPRCARTDAGVGVLGVDGGLAAARGCDEPSDCTWVQSRCSCFSLELDDVTALNREFRARFVGPACESRCKLTESPYLVATCRAARCEVIDVRADPVSASCSTPADCRLRVRDCCECGGDARDDRVIALPPARFADYQTLVCDEPDPVCDACLPTYPPTEGFGPIVQVGCDDGHCTAAAVRVEPE